MKSGIYPVCSLCMNILFEYECEDGYCAKCGENIDPVDVALMYYYDQFTKRGRDLFKESKVVYSLWHWLRGIKEFIGYGGKKE